MAIGKSLVLGACHNLDFYIFVSYLSLGNFLLFISYTYESQYDGIFDWITCTMIYCQWRG